MKHSAGVHLREVRLRRTGHRKGFPFSTAVIRSLDRITFDQPVTFFVGENGSGKSTLLEGIALAAGLPTVGAEEVGSDTTLVAQRELARLLTLSWSVRTHRGFFLRAEDFFGFARRLSQLKAEMKARIEDVEVEFADASDYAKGLAAGPAHASLAAMESSYGEDLDARSHGESFLALFQSRFVPGGLYIMDEPEAPLSPRSQLALLAMLGDMVREGGQFIIATHSPMLLAFPGAAIYSFDRTPPGVVEYEELEHVTLTRDFLLRPGQYLKHLNAER